VPVERSGVIRIGEDQRFGDVAEFDIAGEKGEIGLAVCGRHRKVGAAEQGAREEEAESLAEPGMDDAGFEAAPQDHMRRQIFHRDQRLALIEMIDLRRSSGIAGGLADQSVVFEEGAPERQGPAFADQPDVGQSLLHHDAPGRPLHDEDEIEIAVADFPASPQHGVAEAKAQFRHRAQPLGEGIDGQGAIGGRGRGRRKDLGRHGREPPRSPARASRAVARRRC
jgi:hypothetical protein